MLATVFTVLWFVVQLFLLVMFVRFVLDWVQVFARDWRPRGAVLVEAEITYTITDPPIRAVRRVIPPLNLGGLRLDLAFLVVVVAAYVLSLVLANLASGARAS